MIFYKQLNSMDCGPTCLRMVAKFYGKEISIERLKGIGSYGKEGISMLGISDIAENIGLHARGVILNYKQLISEVKLPAILHWGQTHFVVIYPSKKKELQ